MNLLREGAGSAARGPSAALLLTEPPRGLADLAALLAAAPGLLAASRRDGQGVPIFPGLLAAPRGNGHGVPIFPGLLAGDLSTRPLRGFLRWLSYDARGWDLGRNYAPTETVMAGRPRALLRHAERTGRAVSLIGRSLGRQVPFRPPLPLRPLYPRSAQDPR